MGLLDEPEFGEDARSRFHLRQAVFLKAGNSLDNVENRDVCLAGDATVLRVQQTQNLPYLCNGNTGQSKTAQN